MITVTRPKTNKHPLPFKSYKKHSPECFLRFSSPCNFKITSPHSTLPQAVAFPLGSDGRPRPSPWHRPTPSRSPLAFFTPIRRFLPLYPIDNFQWKSLKMFYIICNKNQVIYYRVATNQKIKIIYANSFHP